MDRRQQKTRRAVFDAFTELLASKQYADITVLEIIEKANVGRSTFYDHFETKEMLLKALCAELFDHVIQSALDGVHTHGLYSDAAAPESVCMHMLQHLQENGRTIMLLFNSENNDLFMRYFREGLEDVARRTILSYHPVQDLPEDLLAAHVAGTFISLLTWWTRQGMKESPRQLDAWFCALLAPLLQAHMQ